MKPLKIVQYVVSLLHAVMQVIYFIGWSGGVEKMPFLSGKLKPDALSSILSNANLQLSQFSFLFIMLSIFTLAFYLTINAHLTVMITEAKVEEAVAKMMPHKE